MCACDESGDARRDGGGVLRAKRKLMLPATRCARIDISLTGGRSARCPVAQSGPATCYLLGSGIGSTLQRKGFWEEAGLNISCC